jgi:protein-L-isoaspartate O-methyltransferase
VPSSAPTSPALPHRLARLRDRLREARTRTIHQIALWLEHARSSLGIRRGLHANTCYFKELTSERLSRALAARRSGGDGTPGFKDYRVTFGDGSKMVIRCTRQRCYADLMGDDGLHRYARVGHILRPGSRVLEVCSEPMTTGYTGAWLAHMTGESGAVVSIIPDEQGARFAARRYELPNLSVEPITPGDDHGAAAIAQTLAGETNGAFHAIVHLGLPTEPRHRDALMRELWRVLAPGGWMLAGVRLSDDPADEAVQSLRRHLAGLGQILDPSDSGASPILDVLLRKHASEIDPTPHSA